MASYVVSKFNAIAPASPRLDCHALHQGRMQHLELQQQVIIVQGEVLLVHVCAPTGTPAPRGHRAPPDAVYLGRDESRLSNGRDLNLWDSVSQGELAQATDLHEAGDSHSGPTMLRKKPLALLGE
jgi:hypothetical protein